MKQKIDNIKSSCTRERKWARNDEKLPIKETEKYTLLWLIESIWVSFYFIVTSKEIILLYCHRKLKNEYLE